MGRRVSVEQQIGRPFWYCADGANVMHSDGNGVAGLLMKLQREVLGYSPLVPVYANCHPANLAFHHTIDNNHEFEDHVADTMNAILIWYAASQCVPPFSGFANLPFATKLVELIALGGNCESRTQGCAAYLPGDAVSIVHRLLHRFVCMISWTPVGANNDKNLDTKTYQTKF